MSHWARCNKYVRCSTNVLLLLLLLLLLAVCGYVVADSRWGKNNGTGVVQRAGERRGLLTMP